MNFISNLIENYQNAIINMVESRTKKLGDNINDKKIKQNFINVNTEQQQFYYSEYFKNNKLLLPDNFDHTKLHINIEGSNNIIKIAKGINITNGIFIQGYCSNSVIEIAENFCCVNLFMYLGQKHKNFGMINNVSIKIGADSSWETGSIFTYNSNTFVNIGSKCMIANNVTLYNTDAHPIFEKDTNKLINYVKGITIGNHCWLGMNATVLKNSIIPDDSIIGYNATFSGQYEESYCAFAGNPAKCIKKGVTWDSNGSNCGYIENELQSE